MFKWFSRKRTRIELRNKRGTFLTMEPEAESENGRDSSNAEDSDGGEFSGSTCSTRAVPCFAVFALSAMVRIKKSPLARPSSSRSPRGRPPADRFGSRWELPLLASARLFPTLTHQNSDFSLGYSPFIPVQLRNTCTILIIMMVCILCSQLRNTHMIFKNFCHHELSYQHHWAGLLEENLLKKCVSRFRI